MVGIRTVELTLSYTRMVRLKLCRVSLCLPAKACGDAVLPRNCDNEVPRISLFRHPDGTIVSDLTCTATQWLAQHDDTTEDRPNELCTVFCCLVDTCCDLVSCPDGTVQLRSNTRVCEELPLSHTGVPDLERT